MTTHTMTHTNERDASIRGAIEKIVVNTGIGRLSQQGNFTEKGLPQVKRDIALITGQQPDERPARVSIAGFKMRQGQVIGVRATLRGKKMVDFFKRFTMIVLPRVRDFRGINLTSIDAGGVLNVGVREHAVFPEIQPEQSPIVFPIGISIVPKRRTKNRDEVIGLYRALGVPLKKK